MILQGGPGGSAEFQRSEALLLLHCLQPKVATDFAQQLPSKKNPPGWILAPAKRSLRERFGCNWPSEWHS